MLQIKSAPGSADQTSLFIAETTSLEAEQYSLLELARERSVVQLAEPAGNLLIGAAVFGNDDRRYQDGFAPKVQLDAPLPSSAEEGRYQRRGGVDQEIDF